MLKLFMGVFAMFLGMHPAGADMLAVAAGSGNIKSQDADAVFLSYQKEAPKLFNHESLYDLTFGYWNGSTRNSALTIARAVRWMLPLPACPKLTMVIVCSLASC